MGERLISKELDPVGASLYVHHIVESSKVNGPGIRCVVWTQGCSLGCKGCFNPETHSSERGGKYFEASSLGAKLGKLPVDGLTVSGGEPMEQPIAVLDLIKAFRAVNPGTVLLFTGCSLQQILAGNTTRKLLLSVDAALVGPYNASEESNKRIWNNKRLVLITNRISPTELTPEVQIEMSFDIERDSINLTGYPTQRHKKYFQQALFEGDDDYYVKGI